MACRDEHSAEYELSFDGLGNPVALDLPWICGKEFAEPHKKTHSGFVLIWQILFFPFCEEGLNICSAVADDAWPHRCGYEITSPLVPFDATDGNFEILAEIFSGIVLARLYIHR